MYTHPASVRGEIDSLVGTYPVDVKGFRTHNKAWLRDEIWAMTRAHFKVVRHCLRNHEWDYFQFVEIGLDRVQHGFWKYHDPLHVLHEPGSPYAETIRDYYRLLDEELGTVLEALTDDTVVLVVSDHGARRLDGGFCVNEWLVREGLLVLNSYPREVTPFAKLDVNWERTRVWSEGGYYARVFLNVKGREPRGVIGAEDYETFRDEIKARLEATTDAGGACLGTLVFKPEEVYRSVRNVAPDLDAHLRRPGLAVDRGRRLPVAPPPGEPHRARRRQPFTARGRLPPRSRRITLGGLWIDGSAPARRRPDAPGARWV